MVELDYEVENQLDLESFPPFIFDVYDHDDGLMDNTDDFLGRAIIEPEDCAIITQEKLEEYGNDELKVPVEPMWHPFHYAPGEPKCGEVLVAFSVVEHDYNFMLKPDNVDLHTRVNTKEFDCDLLILGEVRSETANERVLKSVESDTHEDFLDGLHSERS